jgi:hypothetical protein
MLILNPLEKLKKILYEKVITKNQTEICTFSLILMFVNLFFAYNLFV